MDRQFTPEQQTQILYAYLGQESALLSYARANAQRAGGNSVGLNNIVEVRMKNIDALLDEVLALGNLTIASVMEVK